MRLWTVHPKYLDSKGLVALWREGLLALKVLKGQTKGYKHHPQLIRFSTTTHPTTYILRYLQEVLTEAEARNYHFDKKKIRSATKVTGKITETSGQLTYEWQHLLRKLEKRDPARYQKLKTIIIPDPHPLFRIKPGEIRDWEKMK